MFTVLFVFLFVACFFFYSIDRDDLFVRLLHLMCAAVYCSVLQCVAVCCSVLH